MSSCCLGSGSSLWSGEDWWGDGWKVMVTGGEMDNVLQVGR